MTRPWRIASARAVVRRGVTKVVRVFSNLQRSRIHDTAK